MPDLNEIVALEKAGKIQILVHEDAILVDLCYPRCGQRPTAVEVGLSDVRAADSVRISYDFDRDGWIVQQATRFSWEMHEDPNQGWVEVAFVQAWGSKINGPGDEEESEGT